MKAFDRVSHDFLFVSLERFCFGPNFINWIKLIYHDVSSSVKTNGWLNAFINLERGLRQGCALSMPLYVLTAEKMAINIRIPIRTIHGIRPPGSSQTRCALLHVIDRSGLKTLLFSQQVGSSSEQFAVSLRRCTTDHHTRGYLLSVALMTDFYGIPLFAT